MNAWLCSGCLLLLFVGLLLWTPVLAAVFAFLAVVTSVLNRRERRRQAAVASQRADESICTFVRGFDYRRTDTLVIRAVYDELQAWRAFPLRATDTLEGDLRVDDDLELDIVPMVAARTGRSLDGAKENPYFGKVKTVADLVGFFCMQPGKSTPAA